MSHSCSHSTVVMQHSDETVCILNRLKLFFQNVWYTEKRISMNSREKDRTMWFNYLCDLKCWINRRIISGITAWETASSSGGRMGFPTWAWGPCLSQNPASFITLVSPQSHAPPACDLHFEVISIHEGNLHHILSYFKIPKHVEIMSLMIPFLKTFSTQRHTWRYSTCPTPVGNKICCPN